MTRCIAGHDKNGEVTKKEEDLVAACVCLVKEPIAMLRPILVLVVAVVLRNLDAILAWRQVLIVLSVLSVWRIVLRILHGRWLSRTGKTIMITGCDSGFGE